MTRQRGPAGSDAREVRATLDAFRHIFQALRGSHRRRASIGAARLFALQQIADHPNASVNDIAARTFTHQSSVSVVIQRLVATGLVVKVPAKDDARRTRLSVTAKGKRLLARAPGTVQEDLVSAVSSLTARDRRTLARLLTTIAHAVTPAGIQTPPPMFFEEREPARAFPARRRVDS
jgi:DNA-binding MarR family transcriptional regulator